MKNTKKPRVPVFETIITSTDCDEVFAYLKKEIDVEPLSMEPRTYKSYLTLKNEEDYQKVLSLESVYKIVPNKHFVEKQQEEKKIEVEEKKCVLGDKNPFYLLEDE